MTWTISLDLPCTACGCKIGYAQPTTTRGVIRVRCNNCDSFVSDARPVGNSAAQALRRLRKDCPELHAEVIAGGLSPHAAMIKAGFRPKTLTIRAGNPAKLAAALRRFLTEAERNELRELL